MGRQDECQRWSFSGGFDAEIFLVQGIPPLYGIFMVDFYGKGREIYHTWIVWLWKIHQLKMYFLLNMEISRCHVRGV